MRTIEIPGPIAVEGRETAATFSEFVTACVDSDARFGQGAKNIRVGQKLIDKTQGANGALVLDEGDWEMLKAAVESTKWIPAYARRVLPFFDAILDAADLDKKEPSK